MNDREREVWAANTQSLYWDRRRKNMSLSQYVKTHREEIDSVIRNTLGDDVFEAQRKPGRKRKFKFNL